ncbi:MAG: hypothetical protein J6M02_04885 [Clostridia bacterium]|nr:hypothetical protein [Clostridia bacterium]
MKLKDLAKKGGIESIIAIIILVALVIVLIVAFVVPMVNKSANAGASTDKDVSNAFSVVGSIRSTKAQ